MKKSINLTDKKVIISRTDSIGDVMLVLPIATWLKETFSGVYIYFLGSNYTEDIIKSYDSIDEFIDWKEIELQTKEKQISQLQSLKADAIIHAFPRKEIAKLAKKAKIDYRIGTSHRLFHLMTCNVKVDFTRKNSPYHESQLNFELLKPFGLHELPTLEALNLMTTHFKAQKIELPEFITAKYTAHKTIILHPKSQGSAIEWGINRYVDLALQLEEKGFTVYFTGTEKEGLLFRNQLPLSDNIIDTTGKLTLKQLIYFISKVNVLVACSTGPLHIAGFTGIKAIGLFSPRKPIHPGRWRALGKDVHIVVKNENCQACASKQKCSCVEQITVKKVIFEIESISNFERNKEEEPINAEKNNS
ncbi:MAG: glycosyltransferase family 9 protein [Flavobacteriia bacterium]|nr:glycosyltransferase family 9 protein [Flavobacteriia bacterium]